MDTRNTVSGPIVAGGTRDFISIASDFTAQGGSASDCGTSGVSPSAVAINVTAVTPDRAGFATVFPFGSTRPPTSSVNYAAGAIVNNAIVAKVPNPLLSSDFSIFSYGQAHYVVDIVGYFSAIKAAPLDCLPSDGNSQTLPAGANWAISVPACPTGYTRVDTQCIGGDAYLTTVGSTVCQFYNPTARSVIVATYSKCCRVPGR